MTRKEKLFAEVNGLIEKYNKMTEGHEGYEPRKKYENNYRTTRKCDELVDEIAFVNKLISNFELKLKIEEYWLTNEGATRKASLEKRIAEIEQSFEDTDNMWTNGITELIMSYLTDGDWIVHPRISGAEIGIKDPVGKSPNSILFGHSFELHYNKWRYDDEPILEINYGTMGSFDPLLDTNRVMYLQGMVKIASNTELIKKLQNAFEQWNIMHSEISKKYNKLKNELKNPFENK